MKEGINLLKEMNSNEQGLALNNELLEAAPSRNELARILMLGFTSFTATISIILIPVIFRLRRHKSISSSRWIMLVMILIGSLLLYGTVLVRFFDPSSFPVTCLLDPWLRELGFGFFYGTLVIKLFRIQMEFQSRKAHRVLIRDKDLLKYLAVILIVIIGYLSAWTALITNDFPRVYESSQVQVLAPSSSSAPRQRDFHHLLRDSRFLALKSRINESAPINNLVEEEDFPQESWNNVNKKRVKYHQDFPLYQSDDPSSRGSANQVKTSKSRSSAKSPLTHLVVTIRTTETSHGQVYHSCRHLSWDYVTQAGELAFLLTGIYLTYCIRNARNEIYREKRVLCSLIYLETIVSIITYITRHFLYTTTSSSDPNTSFYYLYFTRIHLTVTIPLLALIGPKIWVARECSLMTTPPFLSSLTNKAATAARPVDKAPEDGKGGTDGEEKKAPTVQFQPKRVAPPTKPTDADTDGEFMDHVLHEMDPEEVRAELKRVYTQLQVLRNKHMRKDNPHISKRRGGKKNVGSSVNIRRFSLQPFGGSSNNDRGASKKSGSKKMATRSMVDAEYSRSPEESTASLEGHEDDNNGARRHVHRSSSRRD